MGTFNVKVGDENIEVTVFDVQDQNTYHIKRYGKLHSFVDGDIEGRDLHYAFFVIPKGQNNATLKEHKTLLCTGVTLNGGEPKLCYTGAPSNQTDYHSNTNIYLEALAKAHGSNITLTGDCEVDA